MLVLLKWKSDVYANVMETSNSILARHARLFDTAAVRPDSKTWLAYVSCAESEFWSMPSR